MKSKDPELPRWNPYQHFVWSTEQLQAWFDAYGAWGQYDGRMWKPKAKLIGPDRYEVKFLEWIPA
jgi:kynureninase